MPNNMNPMQFLRAIKNPRQFFENQVKGNQQFQTAFSQMQNSANGASPEQMARQMAQRMGMSDQDLQDMYNMIAGKRG